MANRKFDLEVEEYIHQSSAPLPSDIEYSHFHSKSRFSISIEKDQSSLLLAIENNRPFFIIDNPHLFTPDFKMFNILSCSRFEKIARTDFVEKMKKNTPI
jgi:restriction endonuclease